MWGYLVSTGFRSAKPIYKDKHSPKKSKTFPTLKPKPVTFVKDIFSIYTHRGGGTEGY